MEVEASKLPPFDWEEESWALQGVKLEVIGQEERSKEVLKAEDQREVEYHEDQS